MTAEPIETRASIRRQQSIDAAATRARESAIAAQQGLHTLPRTPENQAGMRLINTAATAMQTVLKELVDAGAAVPIIEDRKRAVEEAALLDLSSLVMLADPEAPQLLRLIEEAQALAERIDARRGRSLPEDTALMPGESLGTDLAESLSVIALRVRLDVHGPTGRDW